MNVVYEKMYYMKTYMNWSFEEIYMLPVTLREWFFDKWLEDGSLFWSDSVFTISIDARISSVYCVFLIFVTLLIVLFNFHYYVLSCTCFAFFVFFIKKFF